LAFGPSIPSSWLGPEGPLGTSLSTTWLPMMWLFDDPPAGSEVSPTMLIPLKGPLWKTSLPETTFAFEERMVMPSPRSFLTLMDPMLSPAAMSSTAFEPPPWMTTPASKAHTVPFSTVTPV
jgi:hypothetical protein